MKSVSRQSLPRSAGWPHCQLALCPSWGNAASFPAPFSRRLAPRPSTDSSIDVTCPLKGYEAACGGGRTVKQKCGTMDPILHYQNSNFVSLTCSGKKIQKSSFAFQREKREKSVCFQPFPTPTRLKPGPPKDPEALRRVSHSWTWALGSARQTCWGLLFGRLLLKQAPQELRAQSRAPKLWHK